MKTIIKTANAGKTTEIVRHCAETGSTLIVPDVASRDQALMIAERLGLNIETPLTLDQVVRKEFVKENVTNFAIDDSERVLGSIFGGVRVSAIAIQAPRPIPTDILKDRAVEMGPEPAGFMKVSDAMDIVLNLAKKPTRESQYRSSSFSLRTASVRRTLQQ